MRSHIVWCFVVTLNVLVIGTKVPRQIVYQIRPAPLSAFASQDGTFLLDGGVTDFQFPTFGLKTVPQTKVHAAQPSIIPVVTSLTSASNDSADVDSSSTSAVSTGPSEENSSATTKEEITEVPRFGSSQVQQVLQLQPEQFQQIFQIQPQLQQQPQQPSTTPDVGPRYEFKSAEDASSNVEDIKTAQTQIISEDRLQPAYSERREKRKRKEQRVQEPPGDASYAFGYETDEAARHEVADPSGNVKGWYTYVDDEGTVRKIIYTAGAGKGFVILGKEKIRGPGAASPVQSRKHKSRKGGSDHGYAADTSTLSSVKHQKPASTASSLTNYFNNWNDLANAGTSNPPGPTTIIATAESPSRTKKPVFIVKIKRPVPKDQYDNDSSGYDASSSAQASASSSASSSAEDSASDDESAEQRKDVSSTKAEQDSSYVFGYETDSANRLEKADPYGNVRGSYSYIDPEGVKRTVHYIAGGNTGFQVIHASPSISRGVRLEAPPGYVVKRVPSLRTSESRYPIPIRVPQPSAIVYHIHPDSGWKPWEPTIRKKKVKIHRKKLPKAYFENAQRDGIVLLQTHPDLPSSRSAAVVLSRPANINVNASPNSNPYFKEKITAAGSGMVTATETQYPRSPIIVPVSKRRHAPQRGYTAESHLVHVEEDFSKEQLHPRTYLNPQKHSKTSSNPVSSSSAASQSEAVLQVVHEREPLLYSPTFETPKNMPIPNPIQLKPTQVAVKNKGAPTQSTVMMGMMMGPSFQQQMQAGLATSSSNHHPVAFTSDGKLQVDVPRVVIEAIQANSPSLSLMTTMKKVENQNAVQQKLPEPAALRHQLPPPPPQQVVTTKIISSTSSSSSSPVRNSSPSPRPTIKLVVPTTPTYEFSSASASSASYKHHYPHNHNQQHHQQVSTVTVPTSPATKFQTTQAPKLVHKQQALQQPISNHLRENEVSSSPTSLPHSRSRRRHHRSKSSSTASTSPTTSSSSMGNENLIETTTVMSSSKRLMNRLASVDHDSIFA